MQKVFVRVVRTFAFDTLTNFRGICLNSIDVEKARGHHTLMWHSLCLASLSLRYEGTMIVLRSDTESSVIIRTIENTQDKGSAPLY